MIRVPLLATDVHDLATLGQVADHLLASASSSGASYQRVAELHPGAEAELGEAPLHVGVDGVAGDDQRLGDGLVGQAVGDQGRATLRSAGARGAEGVDDRLLAGLGRPLDEGRRLAAGPLGDVAGSGESWRSRRLARSTSGSPARPAHPVWALRSRAVSVEVRRWATAGWSASRRRMASAGRTSARSGVLEVTVAARGRCRAATSRRRSRRPGWCRPAGRRRSRRPRPRRSAGPPRRRRPPAGGSARVASGGGADAGRRAARSVGDALEQRERADVRRSCPPCCRVRR